jgi:hypothetical protein
LRVETNNIVKEEHILDKSDEESLNEEEEKDEPKGDETNTQSDAIADEFLFDLPRIKCLFNISEWMRTFESIEVSNESKYDSRNVNYYDFSVIVFLFYMIWKRNTGKTFSSFMTLIVIALYEDEQTIQFEYLSSINKMLTKQK